MVADLERTIEGGWSPEECRVSEWLNSIDTMVETGDVCGEMGQLEKREREVEAGHLKQIDERLQTKLDKKYGSGNVAVIQDGELNLKRGMPYEMMVKFLKKAGKKDGTGVLKDWIEAYGSGDRGKVMRVIANRHRLDPEIVQLMERAIALKVDITCLFPTTFRSPVYFCGYCGKSAIERCGRCKRVWYCCKGHQVQHWKSHKKSYKA
jgi:hypothetical protein